MPFQFIDNTIIDRKARKLIRSHAAKGKNIGRKLSRPSRQKISPHKPGIIPDALDPEAKPILGNSRVAGLSSCPRNETSVSLFRISHQIGDELSVVLFPFYTTPKARSLVQRGVAQF